MARSFWPMVMFGTAASALAGCSGSGGGAPPAPPVLQSQRMPIQQSAATKPGIATAPKDTAANRREALLLAPAVDRKARFAAARSSMRTLSSSASRINGCTPLNVADPAANGLTAKLILTHAASHLDVDGTNCDLAVYIPAGENVSINDSLVGGAGTAQIAADANANLNVQDTHINAGQQTVGIYFFQDGTGTIGNSDIKVLDPAPWNALPIQQSLGPAGIIGPSSGELSVNTLRIDMAQNATGILALGTTNVEHLDVESHFVPAYGSSQFLSPGIFTAGTTRIRDSLFNDVTTDGFGIGMTFESGGSGSSSNTVVRADFVGHAIIFSGNVSVDRSFVSMPLPTPPFGTYGVRMICYTGCTGNTSVHNVIVQGNGYHDPTTPDFANDSIGFQFSYPVDLRDNLANHNSVGFYSCNSPNITSSPQLQALLTQAGNRAVNNTSTGFFAGFTFNDCQ